MLKTMGLLLASTVAVPVALSVADAVPPSDDVAATRREELRRLSEEYEQLQSQQQPQLKCDALPGGFYWRYADVPKMPNPTGYYWRFTELPKDVQDCWNLGPCNTPQKASASRAVTPGAPPKGD